MFTLHADKPGPSTADVRTTLPFGPVREHAVLAKSVRPKEPSYPSLCHLQLHDHPDATELPYTPHYCLLHPSTRKGKHGFDCPKHSSIACLPLHSSNKHFLVSLRFPSHLSGESQHSAVFTAERRVRGRPTTQTEGHGCRADQAPWRRSTVVLQLGDAPLAGANAIASDANRHLVGVFRCEAYTKNRHPHLEAVTNR